MDISVSKDFVVNSKSLKDVRDFAREIFDKSPIFSEQKDELVLAIAEAAQNIVKHAYKDIIETNKLLRKLFKKLTVSNDCKLNEKIPFIKTKKGIEK